MDLLNFAYTILVVFWGISYFVVLPVPVNLIVTSTAIIYIGSHRSLNLLIHEADGGFAHDEREVLSAKDAYKFPVIGSLALFGLYLAFKFFDKDTVNLILSLYFSIIGVVTLTSTFSKFVSQFIRSPTKYGFKKTFPLIGEVDAQFTVAEMICFVFATWFSVIYFQTKNYMMNNIFGISLCVQAIERISLGNYKVGAILLIGLFFYDIFWVFGTDVMVTVAKSFDGPIKLLFPRVLPTAEAKGEFSLLGLGDIVIPGLFVALLLRFDLMRAKFPQLKNLEQLSYSKLYFHVNVLFYALGLVATVGVMYYFSAAQPALLYLVPACLIGSIGTAIVRGEIDLLLAYNEDHLNKKPEVVEEGEKKGEEGVNHKKEN